MVRSTMPTIRTRTATPSRPISLPVAGQPAELSSISGQLLHGCKNMTKAPAAPARVSTVPHVAYSIFPAAFMLHPNTATPLTASPRRWNVGRASRLVRTSVRDRRRNRLRTVHRAEGQMREPSARHARPHLLQPPSYRTRVQKAARHQSRSQSGRFFQGSMAAGRRAPMHHSRLKELCWLSPADRGSPGL